MHFRAFLLAAAGLPSVFGQYYGDPASSSSSSSASSSSPSSTTAASGSVQTVEVAKGGGFAFTPDTLTVTPGSQVVFQFDSVAHSVTQSSFDKPCQPISPAGINSGFSTTTSGPNSFFTITVNSTDPIFIYCAQVGHCQGGMNLVINQNGANTLTAYRAAAQNSGASNIPANIQGGVFGNPPSAAAVSSSSTAKSTPTGAADMLNVRSWMYAVAGAVPMGMIAMF